MPALEIFHREGCDLPHWDDPGLRAKLRFLLSTIRCNGQPNPYYGPDWHARVIEEARQFTDDSKRGSE